VNGTPLLDVLCALILLQGLKLGAPSMDNPSSDCALLRGLRNPQTLLPFLKHYCTVPRSGFVLLVPRCSQNRRPNHVVHTDTHVCNSRLNSQAAEHLAPLQPPTKFPIYKEMDEARLRGKPRGRGSAQARGGRGGGRGKAARARGAARRGMRVPPEYLQRVIAERQGLDPNTLPDENEDEDEDEGKERRYRPRVLETNADRYRELDNGDVAEDDEELASTYVFLVLAMPGE
jgi:hypothetical protein